MSHFWLGQGIGFVAVIVSLTVYQFNDRVRMLQIAMASALLFALSFLLLEAYTGAALNLLGAVRCYAYFKVVPSRKNSWIFWLFAIASIAATVLTWGGLVSLLALAGTLLYGLSEWQKNTTSIRRLSMFGPPIWFSYNMIVRSYPGMAIEIAVIVSNVIGQLRFDRKRIS